MKLGLPERGIRRADLVVGGAMTVWIVVAMVAYFPPRMGGDHRAVPLIIPISIEILTLMAWANACLGVLAGRRWGFVWMASLTGLMVLSAAIAPLMPARATPLNPLGWSFYILGWALNGGVFLYCLARIRGETVPLTESATPGKGIRIADAVAGLVNGLPVIALFGYLCLGFGSSHANGPTLAALGIVGLSYLGLCVGVGLGKQWAFIVFSLFESIFILGESPKGFFVPQLVWQGVIVLAVQVVTVCYCLYRIFTGSRRMESPASEGSPEV